MLHQKFIVGLALLWAIAQVVIHKLLKYMLYHIDFRVEYPADLSQADLFKIWAEEADAALGAKQAGVVVDLWKCAGTRRVIAIADVPDPDTLDRILLDLPIMKSLGQHITVEVTPLRRYEDFASDLKSRAG